MAMTDTDFAAAAVSVRDVLIDALPPTATLRDAIRILANVIDHWAIEFIDDAAPQNFHAQLWGEDAGERQTDSGARMPRFEVVGRMIIEAAGEDDALAVARQFLQPQHIQHFPKGRVVHAELPPRGYYAGEDIVSELAPDDSGEPHLHPSGS